MKKGIILIVDESDVAGAIEANPDTLNEHCFKIPISEVQICDLMLYQYDNHEIKVLKDRWNITKKKLQ